VRGVLALSSFVILNQSIYAQNRTVDGRTIFPSQAASSGNTVLFYPHSGIAKGVLKGTSGIDGTFVAVGNLTGINNHTGTPPPEYTLPQNFPNPFSQETIVQYTLPVATDITIDVCDILGRSIYHLPKGNTSPGMHTEHFNMSGYANGVYFVRVKFGDLGTRVIKSVLVKDSQISANSSVSANSPTNFTSTATSTPHRDYVANGNIAASVSGANDMTTIDSAVVYGPNIGRLKITNPITFSGDTYNIGDIIVQPDSVTISGDLFDVVNWDNVSGKISGAKIKFGNNDSTTTDLNGHYSIKLKPGSVPYTVTITHPNIRGPRITAIRADNDKVENFDAKVKATFSDITDSLYSDLSGRIWPGRAFESFRWIVRPDTYFKTDTSTAEGRLLVSQITPRLAIAQSKYKTWRDPDGFFNGSQNFVDTTVADYTPGKYTMRYGDDLPYGYAAATAAYIDTSTGVITGALTIFRTGMDDYNFDIAALHEITTAYNCFSRSNITGSVWNYPMPYQYRNMTGEDEKICVYQYSRPPKSKAVDQDNGWFLDNTANSGANNPLSKASSNKNVVRVVYYTPMPGFK